MSQLSVNAGRTALVILLASVAAIAVAKPAGVQGKIDAPAVNAKVPPEIAASGKVRKLGKGTHLWLAVKKGTSLWPKEPEVTPNGETWSATVSEGGTPSGGKFALVLLAADDAGNAAIGKYLQECQLTGRFPAFTEVKDLATLAEVPLTMVK